jgi:hypothetical protein
MVSEWLSKALSANVIQARRLSPEESQRLIGIIIARFTIPRDDARPLWETFQDDVSRRRTDGWSVICDYATDSPILLFQQPNGFAGYQFASGDDLRNILADTPGFELFVTDERADYVLCHNDHDFLIGVGACREWLSGIEEV